VKLPFNIVVFCAVMSVVPLGAAPIFGIESIDLGGGPNSQAPTTLYRFNSTNGVYSGLQNVGVIARGPTQLHADALAYSSQTGLFAFELSGTQSRLVRINESTGQATTVGGFLGGDFRGAAFFGNELLVLDSAANRIVTIDAGNGTIVSSVGLTLGASNYNLGNSVDLAVNRGVVYVIEGGRTGAGAIITGNGVFGTNFFSVDVGSGLLTLLRQDLVNEPVVNQRLVGQGWHSSLAPRCFT
jgi:outer membrane protein assembly factor BamB